MARIDPTSSEFLAVKSQAAELVRRLGSVNKASNALAEALGGGRGVYPNRLHALLGDETTKTVNERTFRLISEGLGKLQSLLTEPESAEVTQWTLALVDRWKSSGRSSGALSEFAAEYNLPIAVIRHALEIGGVSLELPVRHEVAAGALTSSERRAPDYSFQDAAVDRCLAVFPRDSKRRAGLVVPTGGGKTDIALRVALASLKDSFDPGARVIWVTHRRALRDQARDRLQVMLQRHVKGLTQEDIRLFGEQIEFVMLKELPSTITRLGTNLRLIIIDEAHHAAAESYDPAFEIDPAVPVLALTATPNRTDNLPIRIDEIAFSITFRELADRGVILRPTIEPFRVDGFGNADFEWTDDAIDKLAGRILEGAGTRYHKVLVIAPQIDKVVKLYEGLRKRIAEEESSFFATEDVHYISSHGNSAGTSNEEFLATFRPKQNAIVVSAQLLLEGYDDPLIDTVVITYRTESVIMLMQAAGRCVRYHPEKSAAYVIQSADERMAYFFDHRWLYQDLSDFPRPQLIDREFSGPAEREALVRELLSVHSVPPSRIADIVTEINALPLTAEFQFLLAGEPYYKSPTDFESTSRWHVCVMTPATRAVYVEAYNELCALGRKAAENLPVHLVREVAQRHGVTKSTTPTSPWVLLFSLSQSLQNALMEVHGFDREQYHPGGRVPAANGATSWLKYASFVHRPKLPQAVLDFTADAVNADAVRELLICNPGQHVALVRQPLPIGACEVFALTAAEFDQLTRWRSDLLAKLAAVPGASRWAEFRSWLLQQSQLTLPIRLCDFLGFLTRPDQWAMHVLSLTSL
jgi:superfamily II DNA or RNA helicase